MKTRHSLLPVLALAALIAMFCSPRPANADPGASFDYFYDSLDPYGEWVEVPDYGYCWHPSGVDEDWAPYSDGYWAYTDAGWTWVSYEDWGGITYHYGRWVRLTDLGWCWVPGYEWGPAWVSWRSNDDYIGWAPLPPEVVFSNDVGISVSVDAAYGIGPGYYNFCRYRDFGAPALRPFIINHGQNVVIINNTTNITNITMHPHQHLVFNGGPDFRLVQSRSTRPIQTLKLVQHTDVNAAKASGNGLFAKQHGSQLDVLAPPITQPANGEKPRPRNIGKVVTTANVDKGWSHVSDSQAKQLKTKFQQQTQNLTPEQSHAQPVTEKDLRVITDNTKTTPKTVSSPGPAGGTVSPEAIRGTQRHVKPSPTPQPAASTITPEPGDNTGTPASAGNNKRLKGQSQNGVLQPFLNQTPEPSNAQTNQLNRDKALENKRQQDAERQQQRALIQERQQQVQQEKLQLQQQKQAEAQSPKNTPSSQTRQQQSPTPQNRDKAKEKPKKDQDQPQ